MFSARIITLVAALCILGLANAAGADSWSDKLKDAAGTKDVEAEVTRSKEAIGEKTREAAEAKDEAASDASSEAQKPAEAKDVDVASPAPKDQKERLEGAAKTGAVTATDAALGGAELGSAAQKGGAAAVNKYMGSSGEAAAAPSGESVEAAEEAGTPKQ
jgi:hypothetical protein